MELSTDENWKPHNWAHVMASLCLRLCIDKSKISTGSNMGATKPITKEMHIWRFWSKYTYKN
jgi:hypothetical protein